MAAQFASGSRALGICDVCGFRYLLKELKGPTLRGRPTGRLACTRCYDPDHPQNFQGMQPINDPQALQNPRPDIQESPVPPYNPTFIG